MAVKILTDSTSYIKDKVREELDIRRLCLSVTFPNESFKESEINNEDFYKKMNEYGIPVSSQPSVDEVFNEMNSIIKNGDSILCVLISSEMSGTYSTAHLVKNMILEETPDAQIEILDSRSNSMQLGFAAIVAARVAKEGKSLEEVKVEAEKIIARSRFLFIPDNLEYLKKGGRIGGASALIGSFLRIIPILTVENGVTTVITKIRTKSKAVAAMLDKMYQDIEKHGLGEVIVHHINCHDEATELANKIKEKLNVTPEIVDIGPVIGLHVGPGAIGIVYYTEEPLR
ncbi:EDD domain protein, DegV family [Clostridium collagenovorans DSM 3089]|uniref:EDD domain protein, DegV family n=1 Tax=Clostridium collagenovorans DSM 3089 TaxID=1121306 RepID=A0A1M5X530_9CLOT|nr:DegV family protein [Clostridium collagenovorans]SHH94594.1 EDD domain protein, DegV family [Clostridium collagenovorans DSM 3089]